MNAKFKVKSIELEIRELRLLDSVNREVKQGRVRRLEREMDLDALGRFAVWREGRNFYIIDGQHRKLALEGLGLADWKVRCDVYEGMSFMDACEQFLKLNDGLTVTPYEKFDKGVKAGRIECVETKTIVESFGLRVSAQAGDGKLACPAAAVEVWKMDQGDALPIALSVATGAWGQTAQAVEGHIVRGLGIVASRYNGDLDYNALTKKLAKYPGGPLNLLGIARSQREFKGGSVARNVAAVVVDIYNKGRRAGQLSPL